MAAELEAGDSFATGDAHGEKTRIAEAGTVDEVEAGAGSHAIAALSIRRLAPQILAGGVAPFVVYEFMRHFGLADDVALATSAVPPALLVVASWTWKKRLDPIGAIALVGIMVGLATMVFMNGNEVLFKMRDSVVTGTFGLICILSLVLPVKPAMFFMGRAFTRDAGEHHVEEFDSLWHEPRARHVFAVLTLVWGVGLIAEASVRAILIPVLSTGAFLAVTPVIFWCVLGSLIYFTVRFGRASIRRAAAETAVPRPVL